MKLNRMAIAATALFLANPVQAAVYEWTDDSGVVHYSDNEQSVPSAYRKRMKKRPESTDGVTALPLPAPPAAPSEVVKSEGRGELFWRRSFADMNTRIRAVEERLKKQNELMDSLHRQIVRFHKASDRKAYQALKAETARYESVLQELKDKLATLESEANREGVRSEWRDLR